MMRINLKLALSVLVALVFLGLLACGQGSKRVPTLSSIAPQQAANGPVAAEQSQVTWPAGLPKDRLQPWEEVDENGRVLPPKAAEGPERSRRASNINFDSIFVSGIERYLEAGDVTDYGEASRFTSGAPGEELVSYAIYRISLGAEQPGTIAADVNLHNGSSYYLGVGDYSVNTWHWYGPFAATHVRFNVPDAEYASGIGNLMLAVVAYDGASFDVVALGANVRDAADTEAPPIPTAPALTAVAGGVFAEWFVVAADDLAGYRIYANGVEVLDYIEGGTSIVIPATSEVEVRLSAVDISGNESELSDPATETPLAGEMPLIELTASAASGVRNDSVTLTATGGETYDWDIDGDGVWDVTDDATGTADADTSDLGVIRPALRAHTGDGGMSLSAVSLFITGNFRPVVMATVDVSSGPPPLDVEFTLVAEDDDGTIAEYAWDFDGDGTFDDSSPTDPSPLPNTYASAGMYNAKFRVTDDEGSWALDTVAVSVTTNLPPVALLDFDTNRVYMGEAGDNELITFNATGSYDPEGGALEYAWDADGNGFFLPFGSSGTLNRAYPTPGSYLASVRVRDDSGLVAEATRQVYAYRYKHYLPDTTAGVGLWPSLAAVDAKPAISHYDGSNNDLRYARAITAYPLSSADWVSHAIDTTGNVGSYTSLAVLSSGFPAVTYYDSTNGDLKFAVAGTTVPDSSGDWATHAVDSTGGVGGYPSLAIRGGFPIISYYDLTNGDLKFAEATVELPTVPGDWVIHTVDSTDTVGQFSSLSVVSISISATDLPAIAYYDNTNGDVKYARATVESPTGPGDWVIYTLDDGAGANVGYAGLAALRNPGTVNGNPVVAYTDWTNMDLKVAVANVLEPSGPADWNTYILDDGTTFFMGLSPSVLKVGGRLFISYADYENYDLKLAKAKVGNPTSAADWWFHALDTSFVMIDWFGTSLAEIDGRPMIAYALFSPEYLAFAIPTLD